MDRKLSTYEQEVVNNKLKEIKKLARKESQPVEFCNSCNTEFKRISKKKHEASQKHIDRIKILKDMGIIK